MFDAENGAAILVQADAEMDEEAISEASLADPSAGDFFAAGEPSGPEIKKLTSNEERKEYALALNASGSSMTDIAAAVDRSPSTIYRWIDEAKESRPLVPQGRQFANVV